MQLAYFSFILTRPQRSGKVYLKDKKKYKKVNSALKLLNQIFYYDLFGKIRVFCVENCRFETVNTCSVHVIVRNSKCER